MIHPRLEARGLCWSPPHGPDILIGINFALVEGEVMAICGANGVGKSSLLRMLYRYVAPKKGTVSLMGRDIWLHSARETARLYQRPFGLTLLGFPSHAKSESMQR